MAITRASTFLMFQGEAEAALNLYREVFAEAELVRCDRHPPEAGEAVGKILKAVLKLGGQTLVFFDSPMPHGFTFTPAISLFVAFDDATELDNAFARLSEGGQVMMPLDSYDFSPRFAWCADRFGVSWQLNLSQPD